jgi:hypothetical protein
MRPIARLLLALLMVVVAALALSIVLSTPARAADIYIDTTWVIEQDLAYDGDNIIVRGDIWIRNGGSLTLRNSVLQIDSRENAIKTLTVNETGNLYVYDSEIKNRYDYRYFFEVYNDTVFKDSTVRRLFGWNNGPIGGIRLWKGSHIIDGCTITDSSTYGVWTRRPLILNNTLISGCSWGDLSIDTSSQIDPLDIIVRNCTFRSNPNDPYGRGVDISDNSAHSSRYVNISHCRFEGNTYGIYANVGWRASRVSVDNCVFDRCYRGTYWVVNDLDIVMHNNLYYIGSGGIGIYIYHGSYGNITFTKETYRATSAGNGYGIYLEGTGSVKHLVQGVTIWNTYYGVRSTFGPVVVRDSYINCTGETFYVSGGSTIDVYTTEHDIGSGFVEASGGRITAWQRLNISKVRWSDGTQITDGIVHLINETEGAVGELNLSLGQTYLDFVRWECKRSYIWANEHVYAALLDVDTYFRAPELDILRTTPQEIVFTDDYVPRLTVADMAPGKFVDRSYIALEGTIVERGRGLALLEASIDGGTTWAIASVIGENWSTDFSQLGDGVYDVAVRARDGAGNVARLDFPGVIVDTTPPMILITSEVPAATNVPRLRIEGITEPGATVTVGTLSTTSDEDGAFAIDYPLTEGVNGLVLFVKDRVGNTNQTVMSVLLDTIVPSLVVTAPADGLRTNDGAVFVSGRTDSDAHVTVMGEPVTVAAGAFTRQLHLADGEWDIVVSATDTAGNSAQRTVTVTVDLTPPRLLIEKPEGGTADTADDSFYISGFTDPDIDREFINGEERTSLPGEFAIEVSLREGTNEFTIAVVDAAGNRNQTVVVITRDTTAPLYTIEVEAKDGTILQSGSERYSTSDTLTLKVSVNEQSVFSVGNVEHPGVGSFSFEVALREGRNDIAVDARDLHSNIAPRFQYSITYDPTPPTIVIIAPAAGSRTPEAEVTIRGSTDSALNKVWVNDAPAAVRTDGSFEFVVPLKDGENLFTIKARDPAGNNRSTTLEVVREEKQVVSEPPIAGYAAALVAGLVIGLVLMLAITRMRQGREGAQANAPPPPPPQQPPEGGLPPQRPGGGWEEV